MPLTIILQYYLLNKPFYYVKINEYVLFVTQLQIAIKHIIIPF